MDARRSQVYNALFEMKNGILTRLTPDRALSIEDLCNEIKTVYGNRAVRLVGDGCGVALPHFREAGLTVLPTPDGISLQSAAAVGRCALRQFKEGKTLTDLTLSPLYLRMPQAERERLERLEREKENKTIQNKKNAECFAPRSFAYVLHNMPAGYVY
jgi:tRNA threonylcarbamoyladenosine biosynthesis protein TsaB